MSRLTTGDRTALILYGSETGNSHDVAGELERMASRLHFSTRTSSLDSAEVGSLAHYDIVLIAISTTGQGELPRNSRAFWKTILKKKMPSTYFASVRVAIFGLGDSSYSKFNWAALKLHKRLVQLGVRDIIPPGQGDEQDAEGYDASFLPWLKYLQSSLRDSFLTKTGLEPLPDDALLEPQWLLGLSEDHDANGECMAQTLPRAIVQDKEEIKSRAISPVDDVKWLHAALEDNRRITPTTHWQDVRHLKFTVQGIVPYEPGDLVTIYPRNTTEDVEELMRLMGWGSVAERSVLFVPNARYPMVAMMAAPSLTGPMSLRKLLTNHLDINAIPRRSFFAILAHFSTDAFQRSRLLEFTKPDFVDELYDYTTRPRRSILEVLQEFSTVKVPWQWAAVVLPELRGRQFSIASGGELKRNANDLSTRFELLVAIVQYRTVIRKTRRGVCTRYLGGLSVGTSLLVSLHKGNLGVSQVDFTRPIIMIGPGTGVAPMRSLIWERQAWNMQPGGTIDGYDSGNQENYWSNGRSVLFFGCRNEDSDYFFRHEWNELEKTTSFKVFTAFSRDQIQRIYVQDVIKSHGELVYDILGRSQGIVYVCGSSGKMPMAVREALVSVFQTFGNLEREKAELYLSAMEKESRYKQETW